MSRRGQTSTAPWPARPPPITTTRLSTFSETPTSRARERRPTALLHPADCASLGVAEGDRVELGNERGKIVVHVRPRAGQARGVVVVERIWPNRDFEGGLGINALTSAEPGYPNGGAVFHDTAVWIRRPWPTSVSAGSTGHASTRLTTP
jgi:anaerobic selenocysteine-containing dehydrogenase